MFVFRNLKPEHSTSNIEHPTLNEEKAEKKAGRVIVFTTITRPFYTFTLVLHRTPMTSFPRFGR